jgi:NAD(P)-dependent dehydrogenase (short-subunit alcohol dehydrogenase family)
MPGQTDVWTPPDLGGTVTCVTGASYGVGRAVAEVLGQCGATVYVTGRSARNHATKKRDWTVEDTAALVNDAGGRGVPVRADHTSELDVRSLFTRIGAEGPGLDLLVNNAWQWGPRESYEAATWEQPLSRWDAMFGVGVRSLFLTTRYAIPLMLVRTRSLIVCTQERPGDREHFGQNIVIDSATVAMQRMIEYLGNELAGTSVAALLVYLGWVRTVNRGMGFDPEAAGMSQAQFDAATQSPYLAGRAIAMLFADERAHAKTGHALYAGQVALEYGFTDIDGRVPSLDGRDLSLDPGP